MKKDNEKNLKNQQFVPYFKELRKKYPSLFHLDILIYGEIYYKNNLKQGCFAGNEFFAEEFNESIRTIQRSITKLIELGLVSRVITSGTKRKLYVIEEEFNPNNHDTHDTHSMTPMTPYHDTHDTLPRHPRHPAMTPMTPTHDTRVIVEEKNKENNKEKNKNNNEYNNNISKNSDFVGELNEVATITSTNTPTGGDNQPRDFSLVFKEEEVNVNYKLTPLNEDEFKQIVTEEDLKSAYDCLDNYLKGDNETDKYEEYKFNKITSTKPTNDTWDNVMEDNDDYGDTIQF
jgi:hypothetical protein